MKNYVAKKCPIFVGVWFKEGLWKMIGNTLQNTAMYGFFSSDTLLSAFEKNPGIYDETSDRIDNSWRKKSAHMKARKLIYFTPCNMFACERWRLQES